MEEIEYLGRKVTPIDRDTTLFRFTCDRCGTCCVDNTILLNPYDLIRLSRNKQITVAELIKEYLQFHIGPDSKLPILTVKMLPKCTFIENNLCSVYKDRPTVCRSYPVGRLKVMNRDTKQEETKWILNKNCSNISLRLQKRWSIRNWLDYQIVREYYEVTDVWHKFLGDILKIPEKERLKPEWQKKFFVTVYLGYDMMKKEAKKLSDKEILNVILSHAKTILIEKDEKDA